MLMAPHQAALHLQYHSDTIKILCYTWQTVPLYTGKAEKYINAVLQIKSEDEITDLTEPVTVK